MAKYIIDKVDTVKAANKAQEYVQNKIVGLQYQTVEDMEDMKALREMIEEAALTANAQFPRCKKIIVGELYKNYANDGYSIVIFSGSTSDGYIANIRLEEIRENWAGVTDQAKEKRPIPYKPNQGQHYWTIDFRFDEAVAIESTWSDSTYDHKKRDHNLCFRSEASAKVRAEEINNLIQKKHLTIW